VNEDTGYFEELSSRGTEALFLCLTVLFLASFGWRMSAVGFDGFGAVFLCLALFFLFYSLNYRKLVIRLTPHSVQLTFGLFGWRIPLQDIEGVRMDDVSIWRIGGAGIHFTSIRRRYRAMFNFLEHPRVVLELKRRKGPVRDIVFSTKRPEEVMRFIRDSLAGSGAAERSPKI
jgi:hypothetical protein